MTKRKFPHLYPMVSFNTKLFYESPVILPYPNYEPSPYQKYLVAYLENIVQAFTKYYDCYHYYWGAEGKVPDFFTNYNSREPFRLRTNQMDTLDCQAVFDSRDRLVVFTNTTNKLPGFERTPFTEDKTVQCPMHFQYLGLQITNVMNCVFARGAWEYTERYYKAALKEIEMCEKYYCHDPNKTFFHKD